MQCGRALVHRGAGIFFFLARWMDRRCLGRAICSVFLYPTLFSHSEDVLLLCRGTRVTCARNKKRALLGVDDLVVIGVLLCAGGMCVAVFLYVRHMWTRRNNICLPPLGACRYCRVAATGAVGGPSLLSVKHDKGSVGRDDTQRRDPPSTSMSQVCLSIPQLARWTYLWRKCVRV